MDKNSIPLPMLCGKLIRLVLSAKKDLRKWEAHPIDPANGVLTTALELSNSVRRWAEETEMPIVSAVWAFFLFTCLVKNDRYALVAETNDLVLHHSYKGNDELLPLRRDLLNHTITGQIKSRFAK